jgi:hypothetical protein
MRSYVSTQDLPYHLPAGAVVINEDKQVLVLRRPDQGILLKGTIERG